MRDLIKMKDTEKSEYDKNNLNKSENTQVGILEDKVNRSSLRGSKIGGNNWSSQKDKA